MLEVKPEEVLRDFFDYEYFTDDNDEVFLNAGLNPCETELSQKDLYLVVGGNGGVLHDRIRDKVNERIEHIEGLKN